MPHYYFATRDGGDLSCDEVGLVLPDIAAATKMAARSLAELALELIPNCHSRCLRVDVRDDQEAILATELTFKAVRLATSS